MADDDSVRAFYDGLAADYHLIFEDWWSSALRQGRIIEALLGSAGVDPPASVLDCSCGVGTQTLGLAHRGYRVVGSDVSSAAVQRARQAAQARQLSVSFTVADMRSVHEVLPGPFDAVISCDNSLPHLQGQEDLRLALASIRRCLRPGGTFLGSIRDYDALVEERPSGTMPALIDTGDGRRIVGQAWEWAPDTASLRINLFILENGLEDDRSGTSSGTWRCTVLTTGYLALRRADLTAALEGVGFGDVTWHAPEDSGYYQPIVTARAP